jgi:hypothetical protein
MWGIPLENNLKRNSMEGRLKKIGNEYKLYAQDDSCIATSWHSPYQRLSKKNCEVIENGYDLDELAENTFSITPSNELHHQIRNQSFKIGFQKALEILGDKKFSEEDMKKAMNKIVTATYSNKGDDIFDLFIEIHRKKYMDEYIQSLQQTEWDVEIEMWFHGTRHKKGEWIPKLDADGCLILKRK